MSRIKELLSRTQSRPSFLELIQHLLELEYDVLNNFLRNSKDMMINLESDLAQKMSLYTKNFRSTSYADDAVDIYEPEIMIIGNYPRLLYHSFFIIACSIFEQSLQEAEMEIQKEFYKKKRGNNVVKSIVDYKDYSNIAKSIKKIEHTINVNLITLKNEWTLIKNYQSIRNAIVHNNNILRENKVNSSMIKFLTSNKNIEYNSSTREISIISIEFISDFTIIARLFISKLSDEIDKN